MIITTQRIATTKTLAFESSYSHNMKHERIDSNSEYETKAAKQSQITLKIKSMWLLHSAQLLYHRVIPLPSLLHLFYILWPKNIADLIGPKCDAWGSFIHPKPIWPSFCCPPPTKLLPPSPQRSCSRVSSSGYSIILCGSGSGESCPRIAGSQLSYGLCAGEFI